MAALPVATTYAPRLSYGTPVPGCSAPPEATSLAQRIFAPLLTAFADLEHAGAPERSPACRRSVTLWTPLHGVLSLELAGHFVGMDVDPGLLYEDPLRDQVRREAAHARDRWARTESR